MCPLIGPTRMQRFTTLATHRSNRLVWYKWDTIFVPASKALNAQLKWVRVSHGQLSTPACPGNRHTSPAFSSCNCSKFYTVCSATNRESSRLERGIRRPRLFVAGSPHDRVEWRSQEALQHRRLAKEKKRGGTILTMAPRK